MKPSRKLLAYPDRCVLYFFCIICDQLLMYDQSDWDWYKNRYEPNLSNVPNPDGIDFTLDRMIISQIQMFVERYLIHRLLCMGYPFSIFDYILQPNAYWYNIHFLINSNIQIILLLSPYPFQKINFSINYHSITPALLNTINFDE